MSTTFTIDLDVSRALAAQQKMIDKMEGIANAGGAIATGMRPVREEFERLATSTKEAGRALSTISSSTNLRSQTMDLQKINNLMEQLSYWSKIGFGNVDTSKLHGVLQEVIELNKHMRTTDEAINKIASQLRSLPKHKFDFSSVEEYRLKLSHLGQELAALKSFKTSMDPIDYSNMKNSLNTAINDIKQQFRNYTGSKDPYGMIEAFDRTYSGIIEKTNSIGQKIKDSLNVSYGNVAHKDIAESMGFGDSEINKLSKTIDNIDAENKRLGNVLKTSYVGPSNPIKDLINSRTSMDVTSVIQASDVLKSMGGITENTAKAFKELDAAGAKVKTSVDASAQAYLNWKTSIVDATRARTSFYDGMASGLTKWQQENTAIKEHITLMNRLSSYVDRSSQYTMMGYAGSKTPNSSNIQSGLNNISSANIAGVSKELDNAANASGKVSEKLNGLGLVIKRVFEYGMVYRFQNAILSLPGAIWDANAKMEMLSATFRGAFGDDAVTRLNYVKDAANKYGIELISLGESYKKFAVTMEQLNVEEKTTNMIFESTTEALKKAGASSADTSNAFRALIQMYSKGTVSAEEFTRQLSQYIPAANSLAAKSMGVTTAEFKKFLTTGQLIPDEFIPAFSKQMKIFGMGWEEAADTMESNVKRMQNAMLELADSKAFQDSANSVIERVTSAIKDMGNAFSLLPLARKGEISPMTLIFGSPEELDQLVKDYNAKMSTLDSKIQYYKDRVSKGTLDGKYSILKDNPLSLDPTVQTLDSDKKELAVAEKDKWAQQLRSSLKEVASDYTALQQKAEKGINVSAEMNYDRNKIQWLEEQLRLISKMDGQSILVTLDVNADPVRSALALVNKLWANTREGKIEAAQSSYDDLVRKKVVLEKELSDLSAKGVNDRTSDERYGKATEALSKLNVELEETKENYIGLVEAAAKKSTVDLSDGIRLKPTAGSDDESQKEAKRLEYVKKWDKAVELMRLTNGVGYDSKKFQSDMDNNNSVLEGEIATIDKRGNAAAKAANKHALSIDKFENSMDNLLNKEFSIASQDPLGAAFASADEKADSLLNRVEQLALDGGISIEKMTAKIMQFKDVAYDVAVGKEIEKIFPWMKKDNEVVSIFKLLNEEWGRTAKKAEELNIPLEDMRDMLLKAAEAAQQATKEAKLLAKATVATNFGEYFSNASTLEKVKMTPGGSTEKASTKEMADFFIASSQSMLDSRTEMYKRIGEQAKSYGVNATKVEAFIQNKQEEGDKDRLEAIQKVGSAQEAFYSRLASNYETYKSKQTEAREDAIKFADTIKSATDSLAAGIGQSFGDMIRGISDGIFKAEDLIKKMKSRMLDTVANVIETTITDAYKGVFKDIMKAFIPAGAEDQTAQQAEVHANSTFDASSFNTATFTGAVFNNSGNGGGSNPYPNDSKSGGTSTQNIVDAATSSTDSSKTVAVVASSAAAEAAASASSAIWAKNNNPGNLKDISGAWQKFETMQDGVNSMTSYVEKKVGKGYDTISKLGDIYAEGAQVWKDNVSKISGIAKDSVLNSSDPTQIANLIKGITGAEGSGKAVTVDMINVAVQKAASGINSYSGSGKNGVTSDSSGFKSVDSTGSSTAYLKKIGDDIGDSTGKSVVDNLVTSAQGGTSMIIGNENAMSRIFSNGIDLSDLTKQSMSYNTIQSSNPFTDGSRNISGWNTANGGNGGYSWKQGVAGATTAASGVMQMANAQNAGQTIGGGLMTIGGIASMIPGGQLVGGIAAAAGAVISMFSSETKKEVKKVASGYNVGYSGGRASSYGVDFYNDGSVKATGASDPDVQKKISDAFKDTAESLSDFAEELGFAVDVLEGFEFPNMNVTSDQLDGYIRNGENQMAFKGLMEAGLRGAFDAVAEDGEVYVDEYERLATSLKAVKGSFEAYGYDMQTVAQITQEQIDNLRAKNTEVAEGTADAMKAMATSMGAGADTIAQITSETTHASAALSVTDEQLSNILEADYSSKLLDAVGGEDAFKSIMSNLTKNIFDTIEAYAENLDYYNEKAQTSISKLGDATVTVDNFWTKFDEAIKEGLTVDEFEAWGKASDWVNSINSVNDAIEAWDVSMKKAGQSLEARSQSANGLDYQAELTQQLATAEWELYDARKANYDANIIAQIQETQALEMAATVRKHNEDYQNAIQDAQSRAYSITDNHSGQLAIAQSKNIKEYTDYEKTFTHAPGADDTLFKALEQAYALEIAKMIQDWADALTKATESLKTDIAARRASINGLDAEAEALQKLASYKDELDQAYTDGVDSSIIADLQKLQIDEMSKYWADAINDLNKELGNVGDTIADRLEDITKRFTDYTNGQLSQAQTALTVAQQAASTYASASSSIESTMESLKSANEVSDPKKRYEDALAEFQDAYKKGMTGDTTALSESGSLATTLMSAAKDYYANGSQYQELYSSVYSKLGQLDQISTGLGIGADYQAKLLESQVAILTEINNELSQTDPSQEKLTNMVDALGEVSDLLAGTRDVYVTDDATAPAALSAVNTLTGQTVSIGDISIEQLKKLKEYGLANVDATGEVIDATLESNAFLRTQEGILLSGNATQDILRQFSAQNISVSQEIKNAILGDSATANIYLLNVQNATTQMVSLLAEFLDVTAEQKAAQDKLLKQAEVAAAQSAAQTLYNQAVSSVQSTTVGSLTSGMATTGRGWQTGLGDALSYSDAYGMSYLQAIQTGQEGATVAGFVNWYLNAGYGTGSGYVDWAAAMSMMQAAGVLPSDTSSLLAQYEAKQAEYLSLKAQYGFASGGVVPGNSFYGDSIIAGLNSGERVLTAEQNQHFEELVMNSGSSSELIDEVRELRKENAKLREDMNGFLYTIASSNTKMAKLSDDASRRGQLIRTE